MQNYEWPIPIEKPLPSLFLWQYAVLAFVLGISSSKDMAFAGYGFAFLILLFIHCHQNIYGLKIKAVSIVLFCGLFGMAFFYAEARKSSLSLEQENSWDEFNDPMQSYIIQGKITRVHSLTQGRLRLYMENATVLSPDIFSSTSSTSSEASTSSKLSTNSKLPTIPEIFAVTWDRVDYFAKRPVEGEIWTIKTRVRPVFPSTSFYWNRQKVWYTGWIQGKSPFLERTASHNFWANLREKIRYNFVTTVFSLETQEAFQQKKFPYKLFHSDSFQSLAILPALIFGDRLYISLSTYEAFNQANLVHSLALSGQHLALTLTLAGLFIACLSRTHKYFFHSMPRRKMLIFLSLPMGLLYLWLGNAPPSLVRAFSMLVIASLFWLKARRMHLLDSLFLTLLLFSILDPHALFELGVQLSFTAVFCIALAMPLLGKIQLLYAKKYSQYRFYLENVSIKDPNQKTDFLSPKHKKEIKETFLARLVSSAIFVWRFILTGLLISTIIQIGTMPIIIQAFGKMSYFYLLNTLWLPLLALWVLPLSAFGLILLAWHGVAENIFRMASLPTEYLLKFLHYLEKSDIEVFIQGIKATSFNLMASMVLMIFCLYSLRRTIRYSWALVLILFLAMGGLYAESLGRYFKDKPLLSIEVFDVGQGSSLLINSPKGRILMDAGGTNSPRFNVGRDIIAHALTKGHAPRLHAIFISHGDADHINGILPLLETFDVEKIYVTPSFYKGKTRTQEKLLLKIHQKNIPIKVLVRGDRVELGEGFELAVLNPPPKIDSKLSSNNTSMVLQLMHRNHKDENIQGLALLTGDIEKESMENILDYTQEQEKSLKSSLFLIPHHGSETGYLTEFYDNVQAEYAVVSCSQYNQHAFPWEGIEEYFEKRNQELFITGEKGNIRFTWNGQKLIPEK